MPQHSCFYRQKISLPLSGMWGAWGCPSSHRHCLCSNSAARAMTFLIAESSFSRGMSYVSVFMKCVLWGKFLFPSLDFEHPPQWDAVFSTAHVLHLYRRERKWECKRARYFKWRCIPEQNYFLLFWGGCLLIHMLIIANFSQQKETGLGSGEGRASLGAPGL